MTIHARPNAATCCRGSTWVRKSHLYALTDEILPFSPFSYAAPCVLVAPWGGGRMRGRFARSAQSERSGMCFAQIGSRLRARRTHLGLSINSVARELGIGADQYLLYETGAKQASELLLARIADYFG